jgi:catalase
MHRQAIARGKVAYEPNSLAGGCPFQVGKAGFMSFLEPVEEHKVRGKPEKFAEHYKQATLFWKSQSDVEKLHIIRAFRFELTKVQTVAVRQRVVAQLRNVAEELAQAVADGLGFTELPEPLPNLANRSAKAEIDKSQTLSLFARPGSVGIATRKIALLVADGVDGAGIIQAHKMLAEDQNAVPRFVGIKLGRVDSVSGDPIEIEISMETAPSCIWDAVIVADGNGAAAALAANGHAIEFIKDQYRHCKTILFLGAGRELGEKANLPQALPSGEPDPGLLHFPGEDAASAVGVFVTALANHRHPERETDPPLI